MRRLQNYLLLRLGHLGLGHRVFPPPRLYCSPELRRRLDAAFTPAEQPSPERFAFLSPSYVGNCRLLSESGLCSLQVECGEEIMPLICRVYPRAMRDMGDSIELSTSLGCEKTVELLLASDEPLAFADKLGERPYFTIPGSGKDPECIDRRKALLALLSDRSHSLHERVLRLAEEVLGRALPRPHSEEDHIPRILSTALPLLSRHRKGGHLSLLAERAEQALGGAESPEAALRSGLFRLSRILPSPERYIERLLVHHMFHMQLPYADSAQTPKEQIRSFLAACDLLAFFLLCLPFASLDDLVDAVAALFRFLEHSGYYFDRYNGTESLFS